MWADKLSCDKFFTRLGAELWPCMHGVMDVNPALRILADAVRIAIPDAGRQDATVVKNLVFVIAITEDPPLRTRFVGGLQDQGPGETSREGSTSQHRSHARPVGEWKQALRPGAQSVLFCEIRRRTKGFRDTKVFQANSYPNPFRVRQEPTPMVTPRSFCLRNAARAVFRR